MQEVEEIESATGILRELCLEASGEVIRKGFYGQLGRDPGI
jgi:hypothetical protein